MPRELHQNHRELAEAISSVDTEQAVSAIRSHIRTGLESELAAL